MQFSKLLGKKILFFDGAMGTMLQSAGLMPGQSPDVWNATHKEVVTSIHRAYLDAGCNILKTNTFGCNAYKLADTGYSAAELAALAVENAKAAIASMADDSVPRFVAMDIGPTGKLLRPLGDLGFEEAYELFREPLMAGAKAGADLVLIETMSDTYELKAAILAAKENTDLPICVTVTLDQRGRLLTGGDIDAIVALLEGLKVDAIGLNCGLGPREMAPFMEKLLELSSLPIILNPNAGLPREEQGKTVFDVGPEEFAALMEPAAQKGVWILGGCCGTTPAHIQALVTRCKEIRPLPVTEKTFTAVSSYNRTVYFGNGPVAIGERINPTGKARLKQALRERDYDYILQEAIRQQDHGADILDVNAGLPDIDEPTILCELTQKLQGVTELPLQIDTADPIAMERALRLYNGKAMINSVNGKKSSMDAVFPLAARYGGVIVALTLDENGIPETADGRIAIAKRILEYAEQFGIPRHAFVFDPLTMAISAGQDNAMVTLECVRRLKEELGVYTSLGVSNVSFGLPRRDLLNSTFYALALGMGLDAAILNPFSDGMMNVLRCSKALLQYDPQCAAYIEAYSQQQAEQTKPASGEVGPILYDAVLKGLRQQAQAAAEAALKEQAALAVIESQLIPALNIAGERFEKGTLFLPQLLMSADAAKAAFEIIRGKMGEAAKADRGTIVLATVQGDVHDIGKNIVKALLENYRFQVIDLGKDAAPETVVAAAKKHCASLVGLSALMTTTVPSMAKTIALLREQLPACKIMCGGAVLTEDYALRIGADQYCKDAMAAVRYAQQVYPG